MLIAQKAKAAVQKFAKREDGVTAIEYGLIAALIAVVIIVVIKAVGVNLSGIFGSVAANL